MRKYTFIGFAVLGLSLTMAGCKGKENQAMAVVNGEAISREDFYAFLERKPSVLISTNQGAVAANVAQPLNFQALNDLVNQKLLLQMAKDEGVYPGDDEVNKEITFQTSKRPDFVKSLTLEGLTLNQIKDQLRVELSRYKLITKGIKISDQQVDKYIKDNPKAFMNPKTVDLSWIVVKDANTLKSADSDLKSGQTFAIVASQYSLARNPQYPGRVYDQFPPKLKELTDKLKEGESSEWVEDSGNKVKFKVEKKTDATKIEIKPWMKEEIQRQLALQKGGVAVDLDKRLLNKRKSAKLDITQAGLKERFEQIAKTLKESDVKTGTPKADSTAPATK